MRPAKNAPRAAHPNPIPMAAFVSTSFLLLGGAGQAEVVLDGPTVMAGVLEVNGRPEVEKECEVVVAEVVVLASPAVQVTWLELTSKHTAGIFVSIGVCPEIIVNPLQGTGKAVDET
jgi:hypothetical protein